ncbi:unnamed protein product [Dracunculus medinensis]|uniref:Extended synaptotagmin-2 n=1 Tax=Dracunculus medinensis TaxID=318479 RepID=A0A0N4U7S0_DRAME|nr:unnamed protein product [Dracunculus medinensis]
MRIQTYIVPVCGSFAILSGCYLLGHYDCSFFWIILLVILNGIKSFMWRKRQKRLIALRQATLKEREVIMAQLQDLPAWVQFPDTERVEWMNKVILQLWPYIGEYSKQFLREFIEPQVKAQMPSAFKSFKFTKMDVGDIPCRVGGIKVYTHNVGRDRIIVDMDVAYAGDSDFSVSVAGFTGGLNQLQFSGKLRATLKPLLPYPPMIGGISASFLEQPTIDFNLTGLGELVELPGLMNAIRSVVNAQVANICVLPNEIVVSLAPNVDVTKLYFPEPDGIIRLKIIEAKNLENRDISFLKKGKSDPYCEIQVGSQFFKTRTINNDLNPVWNEYFEAIVDQADGQKLRLELFDEDTAGADEELGRLVIDINKIRDGIFMDKWCPLEGCKHGDIHIKADWFDLSSSVKDLEKQDWNMDWLHADKPMHPAILMVFIDNISDLPYPRAKLEPSPFIEISLGKDLYRTPVKVKTVNPLFQSKFTFFVRHPEGQELKIEAIDDNTKRSLGDLKIPLNSIVDEPKMEIFQQTFVLNQGVHQSPIVITARIRVHIQKSRLSYLFDENWKKFFWLNFSFLYFRDYSRGRLQFSLRHDKTTNKLIIIIHSATKQGSADPYVSIKLVSIDNSLPIQKRKTAVVQQSLEPQFDNHFDFDVHSSDLRNYKLQILVKDATNYGVFAKAPIIGMIIYANSSNRWIFPQFFQLGHVY